MEGRMQITDIFRCIGKCLFLYINIHNLIQCHLFGDISSLVFDNTRLKIFQVFKKKCGLFI